jgi:hypothetical protein
MFDLPTYAHAEEPLSEAEWQAYLPQHALYAQRRYRYHARMTVYWEEFQPSIDAYQRLTNRQPEPYTASAVSLLEQLIAEDPAHGSVELWALLTGETDDNTAYSDLASLPRICDTIQDGVRILQMQEKAFTSNVARMSEEWRCMVIALTAVMDERALFGQQTLPPLPDDAPLTPYPDAAAWRALIASDPAAARRQAQDLRLQQARVGLRTEFNALESLAIGRKLPFDMS